MGETGQQAHQPDQYNRSDQRNQNRAQIEARHVIAAKQERCQESTQQGAQDTDDEVTDEAVAPPFMIIPASQPAIRPTMIQLRMLIVPP
jgi:hypothetical protein